MWALARQGYAYGFQFLTVQQSYIYTIFPAKRLWEDFPSEEVCDEESYTITQLHYYSGSAKFLFHFTDLGVSTQTHFSVHLPDVWLRNPTHKPVWGRLWRCKGSLDYGWGKDPEKPRSAFRISGGAPSWTYVTCCVRKLMKTTCSDRHLM